MTRHGAFKVLLSPGARIELGARTAFAKHYSIFCRSHTKALKAQGATMPENQTQTIAPTKSRRGFAITALILGISAVIVSWVPFLGSIVGIIAIIFGIVALKRKQQKAFSLTGLILGALAAITSIIVTVTLLLLAGNLASELEKMDSDYSAETIDGGATSDDSDDEIIGTEEIEISSGEHTDAIAWNAFQTEDAPVSDNFGTESDPHRIGSKLVGDGLELVVNEVNFDATDEILTLAPENNPPQAGHRYTLFHLTVNGTNPEGLETNTMSFYYDTPKQRYPYRAHNLSSPPQPQLLAPNQQVTGNFSGYLAFVTKGVDGDFLIVEHDSFPERQYVALR